MQITKELDDLKLKYNELTSDLESKVHMYIRFYKYMDM